MSKIANRNAYDPVENISYTAGKILSVDFLNTCADVSCNGVTYNNLPVLYNCSGGYTASAAFARGDDVIVRLYKNSPSHIVGFSGDMWPCVKTPALTFASDSIYTYDTEDGVFTTHPEKFYDRYTPLSEYTCEVDHTFYKNDRDAEIGSGFTTIETDWTDDKWNRDTKFYYEQELVYSTYNNETFANVFNGTRSNVFGRYIQPNTRWGCMVYQINTFYNWKPQTSGKVTFDYYLYTSDGLNELVASAYANVNSASVQAFGYVVSDVDCKFVSEPSAGEMLKIDITINNAGLFTSDGSTNFVEHDEEVKRTFCLIQEGAEEPQNNLFSIDSADMPADTYKIYVKNR